MVGFELWLWQHVTTYSILPFTVCHLKRKRESCGGSSPKFHSLRASNCPTPSSYLHILSVAISLAMIFRPLATIATDSPRVLSSKPKSLPHLESVSIRDGRRERPPVTQSLQVPSSRNAQFELGSPQCRRLYPIYICTFSTPNSSGASMVLQELQVARLLSTRYLSRAVRSNLAARYNATYHYLDVSTPRRLLQQIYSSRPDEASHSRE